jgi:hypothetical protein
MVPLLRDIESHLVRANRPLRLENVLEPELFVNQNAKLPLNQ